MIVCFSLQLNLSDYDLLGEIHQVQQDVGFGNPEFWVPKLWQLDVLLTLWSLNIPLVFDLLFIHVFQQKLLFILEEITHVDLWWIFHFSKKSNFLQVFFFFIFMKTLGTSNYVVWQADLPQAEYYVNLE